MWKSYLGVLVTLLGYGEMKSQVGIGVTDLEPSANLQIGSKVEGRFKGTLLGRMTTAERNQIENPAEGLIIYNLDTDQLNVYSANNSQPQWEAVEINVDTADFLQMRFGKYKPIYPALSGITQLSTSEPPTFSSTDNRLYGSLKSNGNFANNDLFTTDVAYRNTSTYTAILYNTSGEELIFDANTVAYTNPVLYSNKTLADKQGLFIDGDGTAQFIEAQNIFVTITGPQNSPHLGRKFLIGFNIFKEDLSAKVVSQGTGSGKENQTMMTYIFEFR